MLREDEYDVTVVARRPDKLEAAAHELGVTAIPANLADGDECVRVVAAHVDRCGGMDVLVNSAGLGVGGLFADLDTKRLDLQLDVNLRSTLIVTRESLPLLRSSKGQIVTIASIAGTIPTPSLAVYGATKAALIAFTNSLNREEADNGVRATAICPAFVATPMTERTVAAISARTGRTHEEASAMLAAKQRNGRLVTVDEVTDAVWLCLTNAALNGQDITLDGGGVRS